MSRIVVVCALLLLACGSRAPVQPIPCDANDPCPQGLLCRDLVCQEDATVLSVCARGRQRCAGSSREACKDDESGWEFLEQCAAGCRDGACLTCVCEAAADGGDLLTCQGDEVVRCRGDCLGFDPVEKCANGCDPATAACR